MIRGALPSSADDAAGRADMAGGGRRCLRLRGRAKAELNAAAALLIDRAHASGELRADFTVDDMPALMCGLGAAIDAMPEPERWRRLVEFALDGLRAR